MSGVEVRKLQPGEGPAFMRSVHVPFLEPPPKDDAPGVELWLRRLEVDRAWVAVDNGRFVGNCDIYSMDVSAPSAPGQPCAFIRMGGVSAVGVHPTHRRRGILTRMMDQMLSDCRQRGEPIAGLIASESVIYGRYGFGLATDSAHVSIRSSRARMLRPAPQLDLQLIDLAEMPKLLPDLYDRLRRTRAGEPNRPAEFWETQAADEPDHRPPGFRGMFVAVCPDGYVAYRPGPDGGDDPTTINVLDLRGATPDVEAGLWQYLFDIDLADEVIAWRRPIDEPLRWRLDDPRQLRFTDLEDRLYVRVLDVPAAFEGRGYGANGRLVLDVRPPAIDGGPDDRAPGVWVLEATPEGATCRPAQPGDSPDLRLDVTVLGALYMGGRSASMLAAAGRIEELRPGGLDTADLLLATTSAPLTVTGF